MHTHVTFENVVQGELAAAAETQEMRHEERSAEELGVTALVVEFWAFTNETVKRARSWK